MENDKWKLNAGSHEMKQVGKSNYWEDRQKSDIKVSIKIILSQKAV